MFFLGAREGAGEIQSVARDELYGEHENAPLGPYFTEIIAVSAGIHAHVVSLELLLYLMRCAAHIGLYLVIGPSGHHLQDTTKKPPPMVSGAAAPSDKAAKAIAASGSPSPYNR